MFLLYVLAPTSVLPDLTVVMMLAHRLILFGVYMVATRDLSSYLLWGWRELYVCVRSSSLFSPASCHTFLSCFPSFSISLSFSLFSWFIFTTFFSFFSPRHTSLLLCTSSWFVFLSLSLLLIHVLSFLFTYGFIFYSFYPLRVHVLFFFYPSHRSSLRCT